MPTRIPSSFRSPLIARGIIAAVLGVVLSVSATVVVARMTTARTTARLNSAATRLDSLTDRPADDPRRAAIVWGYAERLRLGLESPFRLVETASRDVRLSADQRRTVAWALLAHLIHGEAADIDAAALDGIGPYRAEATVDGAAHLRLIRTSIRDAANPRAAELAVRLAYSLAASERIVDAAAPVIAAEAAALIADGEIARREAVALVRAAGPRDPIEAIRERRAQHAFFVERPTLLAPSAALERDAIADVPGLLDSIRAMRPSARSDTTAWDPDARVLAPRLFAAGAQALPMSPLAVTVRRYLASLRADAPALDGEALARVRNPEMLLAVTSPVRDNGIARRGVARLLLASGVAMRSMAQDPVWEPGDTADVAATVAATGLSSMTFDSDVPGSWRSYYVHAFASAVSDLRRVLPDLRLDGLHVRFRLTAPTDSALAMHDPRTRTLHLPIITAGGTLSHELAHDLDRQSALGHGLAGYRSDLAASGQIAGRPRDARVAASLRALTEELSQTPASSMVSDRPAEIFATRVDWFVASSLAREGRSDGFLSAVEDELLTGHVVHPERLRGSSRALVTALAGMTSIAPFAAEERAPTAQALLRWSLAGPVDRHVAGRILLGDSSPWDATALLGGTRTCEASDDPQVALVRLAAESRARGWLRLRARWTPEPRRAAWARATLGQAPWSPDAADGRVAELRNYILTTLASASQLPTGINAYAEPLAAAAQCGGDQ